MKSKPKKNKYIIAWAGYCNGRLDIFKTGENDFGYERLYETKEEAKKYYEEVVKVRLEVVNE